MKTLNIIWSPKKNEIVSWHNVPCKFVSVDDNNKCILKQISADRYYGKMFKGVKLSELKPF